MSELHGQTWLRLAFVDVQSELEHKLKRAAQSIGHTGTQGGVVEDHWIEVMRAYLPKRYEVAKGIVIDSLGGRSDQIDIIVFDTHFTPTLLDQQSHRYIPAEAVYAVFEAKPQIDKRYLEYAGDKAASVRRLHRTSATITHAGGTFKPRVPFEIVAGIVAARSDWSDGLGENFAKHLPVKDTAVHLNCGCALADGAFDDYEGRLQAVGSPIGLMHFLFRLLDKLQSLGTVTAIDWKAYASVLS